MYYNIMYYIKYLKYKNKYNKLKLSQSGGNPIKILIYCHPDKIKYHPENEDGRKFISINYNLTEHPYYLSPILEKILELNGWEDKTDLQIETLDNKENYNTADIQVNGFDVNFMLTRNNEYDIVFVPDCDGKWIYLQYDRIIDYDISTQRLVRYYEINDKDPLFIQSEVDKRNLNRPEPSDINLFCSLINLLGTMVKSKGVLFCSKILLNLENVEILEQEIKNKKILSNFTINYHSPTAGPDSFGLYELHAFQNGPIIYAKKE